MYVNLLVCCLCYCLINCCLVVSCFVCSCLDLPEVLHLVREVELLDHVLRPAVQELPGGLPGLADLYFNVEIVIIIVID